MPQLIGRILTDSGALDPATLEKALARHDSGHRRIGEILVQEFALPSQALYRGLAMQFNLPFHETIVDRVSDKLLRELPSGLFSGGGCMPLVVDEQTIEIAVSDPLDFGTILDVQAATGLAMRLAVTEPAELERCRLRWFGQSSQRAAAHSISAEYQQQIQGEEEALSLDEMKRRTEAEPIVKLVALLFNEAINARASDIHIEPSETNAQVRFRIDGMLRRHTEITRPVYMPLTSRIKILADLDIAEKRLPQDGRIRWQRREALYDLRVSTLPTHHGEKTVVRFLKHDTGLLDVTRLGIPRRELAQLLDHIEKPQGMIFITGPTGSGKSSTIFACLNRIRSKAINITTIENPIEYKLDGVNQVQVNEKAGVTFSSVLRSILRQDPDVILVGEIRDRETAEIAIQASQTGHLVFSTLHTNDAVSAVTRLKDLGVPAYLIASSLLSIVAQRLLRVLCPHCIRQEPLAPVQKARCKALFGDVPLDISSVSRGCDRCGNTGYQGRTGIFELLPVNDRIRELIASDAGEAVLRQHVNSAGVNSLIRNGLELVKNGTTALDELLRVVSIEGDI